MKSLVSHPSKSSMTKWLVYDYSMKSHRYELIDEVYYDKSCDAHYVRTTLVTHDGYNSSIRVYKA